MRGRVSWLLLATLGAAGAGVAHTRSESHSVWEINRANVDLNMTIPAVEVNRLGADSVAPSDEAVKTYLTQKIYAVSAGKRCALVPPVETLSATTAFESTISRSSAIRARISRFIPAHSSISCQVTRISSSYRLRRRGSSPSS